MRGGRSRWLLASFFFAALGASPARAKPAAGDSATRADSPKDGKAQAGEPPPRAASPRDGKAAAADRLRADSQKDVKVAASKPVPEPAQKPKAEDVAAGVTKDRAPAGTEPIGPGAGQGNRSVRQPERPELPPSPEPASDASGGDARTARRSYKVGKPPRRPEPVLPDGAASSTPDEDARRQVAGGPTTEDVGEGKLDAELRELREAERVLFPKPLRGARVGFSWDLPSPVDSGGAIIEASGLPSTSSVPARVGGAAKDLDWLGGLALPNLPTRMDPRVVKYLKFYRDDARGKSIVRRWVKKCGRLTPALKAEFAKAGLPTDLVWLSLIESGHNPTILSPAGAAGLWQFIPESARMYGLTVDRWVDERLDPERSTAAAVRYLADLRTRFGSWELAMAAYNMGHGGLLRSVRKFNTNDFWALSRYEAGLPWETTLYVPKILATAIVMANKKAFGIDDIDADPPLSFDTVTVSPNVDLAEVARAAEAAPDDLRLLNAQYLSGRTPPATVASARFPVRVPAGKGLLAQQRLAVPGNRGTGAPEPHVVRFGDTAETIATEYGTTPREVVRLNRLAPDERLRAGTLVLVPPVAPPLPSATTGVEEVVVVPARRFGETTRKRVFYDVLPGDDVAEIATAFDVTPSELAAWNALDKLAHLQQGMTLQVFVKPDADLSRVRYLAEHEARVLVAGTEEFFEYFEAQNGRKRFTVTAKKGETLASIGRRYGMSAGMMERINRVPAQTVVAEGEKVIVYAKGDVSGDAPGDSDLARELAAISAPMPDALPPVLPGPGTPPSNGARAVVP